MSYKRILDLAGRLPHRFCFALVVGLLLLAYAAYPLVQRNNLSDQERVAKAVDKYREAGIPAPDPSELRRTFYPNRLNLPTMMTNLDDTWFIVDGYNNRVLYNDVASPPVADWSVLDDRLSRPHSIDSDGRFLVVDDTDAHAIRVYRRMEGKFARSQTFYDAGARPHRVIYDEKTSVFYVLASATQEMLELAADGDRLELKRRAPLPSIRGVYARSFRFVGDHMWLLSSNGTISVVDHTSGEYREIRKIQLPEYLRGLNDMLRVGDRWLATATFGKLAQCRLRENGGGDWIMDCVDISSILPYPGNPYFFARHGEDIYLSIVAGGDTVLKLETDKNGNVTALRDIFQTNSKVLTSRP